MEILNMHVLHRNNRVHSIKKNSEIAVSYFQNRRWRLITLLEKLSGFWPHQRKIQQYPLQLLHFILLLITLSAVINESTEYVGVDKNMTLECCLVTLFLFGLLLKLIFALMHQSKRRKIYERIAEHFETIIDPEEVAVLNEGAERGFKYTLYYMCGMCLSYVTFDGIPVLQAFYQYLFQHRELKVMLPLPMNFGLDHSKYWYIIAIHFTMWLCSITIVDFACDLSFMLQVCHVTVLFKIVRIRLRKASELIVDEFESETTNEDAADESYSLVSSAIDLHAECLDLVEQVENCYAMNWFLILLLSTGGLGAGLHLLSTKLHDPLETLRYTAAFVMVMLHFQVIFSQGQIIIDSSSTILDACYECKWYGLPKKSCKLLTMMMVRTSIPCQLTGAKLFPLSMETFSKMLKAALSYYTVFRAKLR